MAKVAYKSNTKIAANMMIYPAVILHPSLGCPLIVDHKGPVGLLIVTDSTFRDAFIEGNGGIKAEYAKGGMNVVTAIRQHLKVVEWSKARELKQNLLKQDKTINVQKEDIVCTYLGQLDKKIKNASGQHIANLHESVFKQFQNYRENGEDPGLFSKYFSNDGLRYVFQIDLHNLSLDPGVLYDSYWVLRNLNPQKADNDPKYLDIQDRITREHIQKNYYKYAQKEGPKYAFKVGEKGVELTPDKNTPIQTHHPIWVAPSGKKKLNIGHLSDVHVSSKQIAYKGRKANVIPGADQAISPPIGNMANNNADNFFDLLNKFGHKSDGADLLVITGDLYDHLHNYDPTFTRTTGTSKPGSTGELWEAMCLEEKGAVHQRNDEYPCGIDALIVYSVLLHYYNTHKKPVFITSGNHEAYQYPYGISPRLLGVRANDGIPLDHNLTFYEAILLYGPGYSKILKTGNFDKENFDWFFNLFTPLTDCVIQHGDQCLIGLGWGDGEHISKGAALGAASHLPLSETGTLPRAKQSISAKQKNLVEKALARQCRDTIFCSHFTLVNYAMGSPLAEVGKIVCHDDESSQYEHGTAKTGRETLHGTWLGENAFQLALGGHSHRVGLYQCGYTPPQIDWRTNQINPGFLQTKGYHPENAATKKVAWGNKTKVLVSASGGPIPKQNLCGEMSGHGMELPSGSQINPDGSIVLKKSGKITAQPRFCVACDYIDLLGKGFWEYFKAVDGNGTFEMKPHWEKIHPKLGDQAKRTLIESVTLFMVGGEGANPTSANITGFMNNAIRLVFASDLQSEIEFNGEYSPTMFLSIKFNRKAFAGLPGFDHYNYDSPWNIQVGIYGTGGVEIFGKQKENPNPIGRTAQGMQRKAALNKPSSWQIIRHKKFGEVPSFKWRKRKSKVEFACDLILKH